jgi:hypothetical protein
MSKPILLTSNSFQVVLNCSCAKLFAIQREYPQYKLHVHIARGCHLTFTILECQNYICLNNDKTNHLPMISELVVGMPIMCTKNNVGPKEVFKGTLGHVIGY